MSEKTYSAREIVLSLFPGTDAVLVPLPEPYRFERTPEGLRLLRDGSELLLLAPIAAAGNASTQVLCDLCQRSAPRHYLQMFRAEVPGSKGRRYRYVSLCRDPGGCEARRSGGDTPVEVLLSRVLGN
ncbi:MAG: hypothetical protein AVDCRST_MAG86-1227 [uncultured Truepera sp.]|uniref:Elongation factor G-binding protein C-terminal treble-clef zinc-finger domain-containing protein n=1 Tax=uncultured Truepera sp. TaxID=543023 RepID=A0A6J4V2R0_9DEIN|nr:MAG: hypothetical protein AVDCRST_MAG86-1227 [uncultured Truepera sp.]